jgi:[acyl-carrier-protein] S-malonyltransferase
MAKIAVVFPGQGAQFPGMGKELYEQNRLAAEVFELAETLRPGTMEMCFSGAPEELMLTQNAQPCLYCVDVSVGLALRAVGLRIDMAAGFSLGELPALVVAGSLSTEEGFRITRRRAELMQEVSASEPSGMLAIMKLETEVVEELCRSHSQVYPANYNCPGQIVVSGNKKVLPAFSEAVKAAGGRTIPVAVSAGFHSPLMAAASDLFAEELKKYTPRPTEFPVYANCVAQPYEDDIRTYLARQIAEPVRWEASIMRMSAAGADTFIEAGPGRVLSGFIRRMVPKAKFYPAATQADIELIEKELVRCSKEK